MSLQSPTVPDAREARWLARYRQRLADTMAERLLADLNQRRDRRRWRTPSIVLLWLLAAPVNLVTTGCLALAGWLFLIGTWPAVVIGIVLLVVVVGTAPRPRWKLGMRHVELDPEKAPELYGLMRRVAAATGAPAADRIVVTSDFNAFATRVGRRRVMGLGAAMWVASTRGGRISDIAHELGHLRRDLPGFAWVAWARESIHRWWDSLVTWLDDGDSWGGLQRLCLAPVIAFLEGYMYLLDLVDAAATRRGEHRADLDSVIAAGTEGALEGMDVMLAAEAVLASMRRASFRRDSSGLWQAVRDELVWDDATRAGRRRAGALTKSRIDDSHPTTALRIRLIESQPYAPPAVVADDATWAAIDAEMEEALQWAAREAVDEVRYARQLG